METDPKTSTSATAGSAKYREGASRWAALLPKADTVGARMLRVTASVPFADDALALYYCAVDRKTPSKIRAVIGAALLYLVLPLDFIPDFLPVVGFTDDAGALMLAVRYVSSHVKPEHRERSAEKLAAISGRKTAKDGGDAK